MLCHSTDSSNSTTTFIHNVSTGGGGADCISCHDINSTVLSTDKRLTSAAFDRGVHNNLNEGGNGHAGHAMGMD